MKKILFGLPALAALGLLLGGPLRARDDDDRAYPIVEKDDARRTVRISDPASAVEVAVDNVWGGITVEGTRGTDIEVVAHRTIMAESKDKLERARNEVKLDIPEKPNSLNVYVDGPFRCNDHDGHQGIHSRKDPGYIVRYDFELKVPFRTKLVLSTVLDGDVSIRGVEGDFDVANVNGEVRLADASGSGKASTVNGGVRVSFRRPPAGKCAFETVNGEVVLNFPEGLSADFRINSMNGDAYTDFPVTALPAAAAETRKEGGRYAFKSGRFIGVRVGKGGPEIKLETLNGDILIKKNI
ncbi:MAG TPA: DUF4097 family beta strand repeat-containing protein [Acidobacteriota bacterium]|nr:DUF4097 family beta strand repeat-containing protein [Acidobacteriota bacterium]